MKRCKGVLLTFVILFAFSIFSVVAVAGEYVAKQGDTWAKVAKETGNSVNELAKMNKLKDIKDSDAVPAGQKIIFLGKKDIEDALKWAEQEKKRVSYGTGEYSTYMQAYTNLKSKRIEYSPDDPYPYGIRFTQALEYAKSWREKK